MRTVLRRASLPLLALALASCWLTASFGTLTDSGAPDGSPDVVQTEAGSDAASDAPFDASGDSAEPPRDSATDTTSDVVGQPDASCTAATTYVESVKASAPIAYWRLDDNSGPTAEDQTKTYDGTYSDSGVMYQQPGIPGAGGNPSVLLDGVSGEILVSSKFSTVSTFPSDQAYTLEAWVKPLSIGSSYLGILSNELQLEDGGREGYVIYVQEDAGFGFDRYQSPHSTPLITPPGLVMTGSWFHVVGVYEGPSTKGSKNVALYVNGMSVDSTSTLLTIVGGCTFAIGASHCGAEGYFSGYVDEVAVYPTALEEPCIQKHHTLGSTDGGT